MNRVERPETFRQSLLAVHDRCPHSAMLYLKHDGGPETHEKTRGTVFHLFMQRATETMLEMGEPTMPGDVGREMAEAIMAENLDFVLSTKEQDVVRQCAWNWCEATALDPEALIGVEVPVEIELCGVKVTGRIDRLEAIGAALDLHDAKTSLNVPRRDEVQDSFQGKLYGLMCLDGVHAETGLSLGGGINEVRFVEEYPRYRTDEGSLLRGEGLWTRAELREFRVSVERNLEAFLRSFGTGEWPARDGSWCGICAAPGECPIPAQLRQVEQITTVAEAEEALSRKLALERESRRLQSGMREWVKANGPIVVGDLAFDASTSQSREIKDWPSLERAIYEATEIGVPFHAEEHVRTKTSTKFAKRRLSKEEQHGG